MRINLTKYGFIRTPENDFSDDGNRFQCYAYGDLRVTKLVSGGTAYISANVERCDLMHEEYSKLPHYRDLDALNGVEVDKITDQDLITLAENCGMFEEEYNKAAAQIKAPTKEELLDYYNRVRETRIKEFEDINRSITVDILLTKFDRYSLDTFKRYYETLVNKCTDKSEDLTNIALRSQSARVVLRYQEELKPSFSYTYMKELIAKLA